LESDGVLLGIGRVLPLNVIHPYSRTLDAALSGSCPSSDAAGLYQALMAMHPAQTFWRAQCLEHHRAARQGLEALGFAEVRRTWTPEVPLSAFPVDWRLAAAHRAAELGYTVGLEPALGAEFRAELTWPHLAQYQATHGVNPPADLSLAEWQEIFLDDLENVFVARRGGKLAAFASVREGGEVFWFGTLAGFAQDAPSLNAALQHAELAWGRTQNLPELRFELDSTDPAALDVLAHLTLPPGEALLTYQRNVEPV